MQVFDFTEAEPLLRFIESHSKEIIGHAIKSFYIDIWPMLGRDDISDEPVVLEMDNGCIQFTYLVYSDLTITVGSIDEIRQDYRVDGVMKRRDRIKNYFDYDGSVKKEDIEGRTVINITVDRFSHEFDYNIQGDLRPEGGDYFSTIRLHLDNGMCLCFCGEDAIMDGYVRVWCEKSAA